MSRKWILGLVAVLVLALGVTPVLAAGYGDQVRARDGSGLGQLRDQIRDQIRDRTCTLLGTTPEQLQQARTQARTEVLEQAVAAGQITAEQAQRIQQRIAQGTQGVQGKMGRRGAGGAIRLQAGRQALDDLAGFLGLTPEELWNALRSGKSVAQVAADQGKTREQVEEFLTTQVKARLDAAVQAGKITKERADQCLTTFQARLPQMLDYIRNCPNGCQGGAGGARQGA